jgi:Fe-S cluster biogenesis protein NfuA
MQQGIDGSQQRAKRIEELVQEVSTFSNPQARATTEELIQALLDMYGEGLAHILELIEQSDLKGYALMQTLASDDLVGSLFMLHDLHPIDLETRIAKALAEVRPYLKSHGGNVQFLKVENGIAYLRLEGSCQGCGASTSTLKATIEEAIYSAAPDLDGLEVEGVVEPPPRRGTPITLVPRRQKVQAGSHPTE